MERRTIANCYFKHRPRGEELMSGLPLPLDPDVDVVRSIDFVDCTFHPNCDEPAVRYINCTFTNCDEPRLIQPGPPHKFDMAY